MSSKAQNGAGAYWEFQGIQHGILLHKHQPPEAGDLFWTGETQGKHGNKQRSDMLDSRFRRGLEKTLYGSRIVAPCNSGVSHGKTKTAPEYMDLAES
jgi:hypothetical protein